MYEKPTDKKLIDWTDLTDDTFEQEVLKEKNKIVVVLFWQENCSSCDMFEPTLNSISTHYGDQLKLMRIKTGPFGPYQDRFKFPGCPTLGFFYNGYCDTTMTGASEFKYCEPNFLYHLSLITKRYNMLPIVRANSFVNHKAPIAAGGRTNLNLQIPKG